MSYKKQNSSIRLRLPSGCRPNDDAGLQVILLPKRTGGAAPQRENDAVCSLKTQAIKEATGALPTLPMLLMTACDESPSAVQRSYRKKASALHSHSS